MKRLALLLCLAAPGAVLLGCSGAETSSAGGAFPEEPLTMVRSDDGAYSIELRTAPTQPPTRGSITVEYRITDASGAARDGLDLEVVPWMPAMGHGASTKPKVSAEGDGRYQIDGVQVFMPGEWELRTTIHGKRDAHAAPALQIP